MDIRSRDDGGEAKERRSAIYLDPGLANVVRKLARLEGKTLDAMVDQLVREWCSDRRPQYELTEEPDDKGYRRAPKRPAAPKEQRKAERRTKIGTAALWEEVGHTDRRKKGRDRRKG
ncbi:MAG: hypothetical protein FJ095_20780 [Deltaproteobacteria bacterium]|nr:hypothetical protein [Deltaproteobacteria bacterium]